MSAHKPEVRLTSRAERDVENIVLHTERAWGANQSAAYASAITRTLFMLRGHPQFGRPRDDLFSGCRSAQVEQHVFFYHQPRPEVIEVVRILHHRQNAITEVDDPHSSASDEP